MMGDYSLLEAAANKRRKQQSIANQNAAFFGQQRGTRNMADLQTKYRQGFNPLVATFGRRGLTGPNTQSGITRKGLAQYAESLQKGLGAESENLQQQLQQINDTELSQQADLNQYLAQLRYDKSKDIYNTASAVKNYSSY
jgi:hypothetical protein